MSRYGYGLLLDLWSALCLYGIGSTAAQFESRWHHEEENSTRVLFFFVLLGISSTDDVERRHLSLVCSCGDGLCASTQPSLQYQKPAMLYIDGHSPFQSCFHRIAHLMLVEPIWLWFIARPLVCALFIWYRLYCCAVRIPVAPRRRDLHKGSLFFCFARHILDGRCRATTPVVSLLLR